MMKRIAALGLALAALTPSMALAQAETRPADVPMASFFKPTTLSGVSLSPDGTQIAMLVPGPKGRKVLALAPADAPTRRKGLAQFDDADLASVAWVNNKRLVFTVTDSKAQLSEQFGGGLYAIDADGENFIWLVGRGLGDESKGHIASRPLRWNHQIRATLRDGSDDVLVTRRHVFMGDARDPGSSSVMRLNTRTRAVTATVNDEPRHVIGAAEPAERDSSLTPPWRDWSTRAVMPTLRIPDFHMSSVSQAQ